MATKERIAGRSARYGQACLNCFRTKCKCIPRPDGNGCERCHRLERECHPADPLYRRNGKKQNSPSARIAQLEGTVGHLVSLLKTGNVNVDVDTHGDRVDGWSQEQQEQQRQSPHQQQSRLIIPSQDDPITQRTQGGGNSEDLRAAFIGENKSDAATNADGVSASWWAMDNANSMPRDTPQSSAISGAFVSPVVPPSTASVSLDTFRSRMLHHFPFVHLPTRITAEQLRQDRPFLFRAIVCVTSVSTEDKRASSFELKRLLYETAFLQQEREQPQHQTVDLLLGLLVYITWGWEHLHSRCSLSRLMAVAILLLKGLLFLDQAVPEITRTVRSFETNGGLNEVNGSWTATPETTTGATGAVATDNQFYLECQRAILGCFVLGSTVSAHFPQIDAPRWIPQMDESLAAVIASGHSAATEFASDAALSIQVRLQLLAMKAAQVRERAQLPDQPPPESLSLQALLYIKRLMGQLQELRVSIPPTFQQHFIILAQTYYTEMCIIESIHAQESTRSSPPTCGPTRISCLWQSALAIKSCTSTFLTISLPGLLGVSFIQWTQLSRCLATLHRLSTLREPGWDLATIHRLVDLPMLLSSTADRLELAAAVAGEQPASADGVFTQLARSLRKFQPTYQERGLLAQQEDARGAKISGDKAGSRTYDDTAQVAATEADKDVLAHGHHAEFLMSPTSWLDQFFADYEGQTSSTL
ncbi:conserved hypothetical protein [Histoplasma capsulatum G186AR]|uniref:Zn(2)-C6 fungal-type domain-containing protein n=2 Tax=Ajellomyces capsulatus TaxID=5037 RepID=C0NNZ5_AJECG|nr:uncharacterized protein HCBG_04875 [Histoplasma capsulatum G186AR]EEH06655.1 conserved hypothetical protein [Histoplasma capsulatum G186AR]KAG5304809.1 C6 transcription factor [Histoplasma capsulatum]QSS75768.1 C6 transcription factor [Histoplasma capsulatum G186AR]